MKVTATGTAKRVARLQAEVRAQELDVIYLYDPKNVGWTTGLFRDLNATGEMKHPLLCVPARGEPVLYVNHGLRGAAAETFRGPMVDYLCYDIHVKMVTFPEDAVAGLRAQRKRFPGHAHRVGVDLRYMPAIFMNLLREWYPSAEFVDVSATLNELRAVKEADEIAVIRECIRLDEIAYKTARAAAQPGVTEAELYGLCYAAVAKAAGEPLYFMGDFVTGPKRCRVGGGPPTNYRIKKGDTIILDLWVYYHGYWADMSRTFVIGRKPTSEETKVHDLLRKAMEACVKKLKTGVTGKEVYQTMHETLDAAGWAKYWFHHAGHGTGCHPHEAPFFIPASNQPLEAGMVVTLEPGVYCDGLGGMRIEDNFLITKTGCERLSKFPHGL
jgi:Xaa-Pro aminopeptidase